MFTTFYQQTRLIVWKMRIRTYKSMEFASVYYKPISAIPTGYLINILMMEIPEYTICNLVKIIDY